MNGGWNPEWGDVRCGEIVEAVLKDGRTMRLMRTIYVDDPRHRVKFEDIAKINRLPGAKR